MQSLNVRLVQTTQYWEDVDQNLAHFEQLLSTIEDADLVLLPEMFQTSFSMNTSYAEEWEASRTKAWLVQQSSQLNTAIYTSFMVKHGGVFYNRGVFVEPNGTLHVYDKRKCFSLAKEDEYFTAGSERKIVNYKGWKIQLQICYDLRFPEIQRNLWIHETNEPSYDLLLFVANWPARRIKHWSALLKARAIENQCFVLGLNRVGLDGNDFEYNGQSTVVDALGEYLIQPTDADKILETSLVYEDLKEIQGKLSFLKDQH